MSQITPLLIPPASGPVMGPSVPAQSLRRDGREPNSVSWWVTAVLGCAEHEGLAAGGGA